MTDVKDMTALTDEEILASIRRIHTDLPEFIGYDVKYALTVRITTLRAEVARLRAQVEAVQRAALTMDGDTADYRAGYIACGRHVMDAMRRAIEAAGPGAEQARARDVALEAAEKPETKSEEE